MTAAISCNNDLRDLIEKLASNIGDGNSIRSVDEELEFAASDVCKLSLSDLQFYASDSNPLSLSKKGRWILQLVLLRDARTNKKWIHYNAMKLLRETESITAMAWCAMHALSVIKNIDKVEAAAPLSYLALAEAYLLISPLESPNAAYSAIRAGLAIKDAAPLLAKVFAATIMSADAQSDHIACKDIYSQARSLNGVDSSVFKELGLYEKADDNNLSDHHIFTLEKRLPAYIDSLPTDLFEYRFLDIARQKGLASKPSKIFCIKNAILSVEKKTNKSISFYIISENSRLYEGLSHGLLPFVCENKIELDEAFFVSDRFSHSTNICHFFYDELTRFYQCKTAREHKQNDLQKPPDIISLPTSPWSRLTWSRVSPQSRIYSQQRPGKTTYRVRELFISSDSAESLFHPLATVLPTDQIDSLLKLRHALTTQTSPKDNSVRGQRRVLITREDAKTRNIINHEAVYHIFTEHNFELLCIDTMQPDEQIEFFRGCNVLAAVHGQALANMIFLRPESTVIELLPSAFGTHAYGMLSHALGHRYLPLECKAMNQACDVEIDEGTLRSMLSSLELK